MRKAITSDFDNTGLSAPGSCLNLEQLATVEVSSEDPQHPSRHALGTDFKNGWRASAPGPQLIRLRFDSPQSIRRIHPQFHEEYADRSQYIAQYATFRSSSRKELVRHQWAFSPRGSAAEVEDYFDLKDITIVEPEIDPGRHDKQAFASLQFIRIG